MVASPVTGGPSSFVRHLHVEVIERQYSRCHGIDVSPVFAECTDGVLEVRRCDDTGYMFYAPLGLDGGADFYDDLLAEGFAYTETAAKEDHHYAREFIKQCALRESDLTVLDVGSGTGNFLETLVDVDGVRGAGLEGSAAAREVAVARGLVVHDEWVSEHAATHAGHYDIVCLFQVLEHVEAVRGLLDGIAKLVKPGGHVIISVPNCDPFYLHDDYYAVSNVPPHHVGLWSLRALSSLAKYFPFELEDSLYYHPESAHRAMAYRSVSAVRDRLPSLGVDTVVKGVGLTLAAGRLAAQALKGTRPRPEMSRVLVRYRRSAS